MKKAFSILSVCIALMFAAVVGAATTPVLGAACLAGSAFVRTPAGALGMAVTPEIWTEYIIGNLFKNNEFLLHSVDESQYVLQGSVVHIPQAGSPSGVKRNRQSLPATITKRKDVDITYALDEFTTDPRFIPEAEKQELSYDKLNSCMMEDMQYMRQVTAEAMLYNWRPMYFIKASKTKSADYLVHGTGVRTGVQVADFTKAKTIFNKQNVPVEGRYVILPEEMYKQLCEDVRDSQSQHLSAVYNNVNGELEKLEGFTILHRSTVLMASNSTLSAVSGTKYFRWTSTDLTYDVEEAENIEAGGAVANTCCLYGLFWQESMVARAMGATKMFSNAGDPQYYGDIYSFMQRLGGRTRRADGKGVLGLIQEYSAS